MADFATGLVRGNPIAAAIEESGRVNIETVVRAVAKKIGENFGEKPIQARCRLSFGVRGESDFAVAWNSD